MVGPRAASPTVAETIKVHVREGNHLFHGAAYSSAGGEFGHLLLRALEGYVLRPKLTDLRAEGSEAPARGKPNNAKLFREGAHDIQRLEAD